MYSDSEPDNLDEWASDQEGDYFSAPCRDLFSARIFDSAQDFTEYAKVEHQFDLVGLFQHLRLDSYERVRCVNFLRGAVAKTSSGVELYDLAVQNKNVWKSDESFLLPVEEADGLLQFAVMLNHGTGGDSDLEWEDEDNELPEVTVEVRQKHEIKQLQHKVEELEDVLQKMSKYVQDTVVNGDFKPATDTTVSTTPLQEEEVVPTKPIDDVAANDKNYFGGYSHHDIHETMLKDVHRTTTYRDALFARPDLLKDKVVLDVGCGTGILSMFAAKAGAKMVIGVDAADIIDKTREIVKKNKLEDKIILIKGKLETIELPVGLETVDVIVSEWMGYFLLYESMLPSVFYARDKWMRRDYGVSKFEKCQQSKIAYDDNIHNYTLNTALHKDTLLFPDIARMFVTGVNTRDFMKPQVDFWTDVYGFDMSVMIPDSIKNRACSADVLVNPEKNTITTSEGFLSLDLMTCVAADLVFNKSVVVDCIKTDVVDCILVWFDTIFSSATLRDSVSDIKSFFTVPVPDESKVLTTSHMEKPTHWYQSFFWVNNVLDVKAGDKIEINIVGTTRKTNHRHYNVKLTYKHISQNTQATTEPCPIADKTWAQPNQNYIQEYILQ